MRRSNKKGFTIVELVIVIAVIAILAAVMIPTFTSLTNNAKDSARDQEAKNAFTNYLVYKNAEPDKNDVIFVEYEGKTYKYSIKEDGNIDLKKEVEITDAAAAKDDCIFEGEGFKLWMAESCDDKDDDKDHACELCSKIVAGEVFDDQDQDGNCDICGKPQTDAGKGKCEGKAAN